MAVLIDTSYLLAVMYQKDVNYNRAQASRQTLKGIERIVPIPVTQELFYMTGKRFDYSRSILEYERFLTPAFKIEMVGLEDMHRMSQIMRQYASASFDYTDTAIMALSERLNIQQVYTFDHRDFNIFPSETLFSPRTVAKVICS